MWFFSRETDGFGAVLQVLQELRHRLSGRTCLVALSTALVATVFRSQYIVLLKRNLPSYSLEVPVLGSTLSVFWYGYVKWSRGIGEQSKAVLTHLFFVNTVVVSWPVYEKYVKKADMNGELNQGAFPETMVQLLGENTILLMKAGKGQEKHHRLRSKVLRSLTPKRVFDLVPQMINVIHDVMEEMVLATEVTGFSKFELLAGKIPTRITNLPVVGGMPEELADRFNSLIDVWVSGLLAMPLNLGRFSSYGLALQARTEMTQVIRDMLNYPFNDSIVGDLAARTDEDEAFSEMEIVDTILTLFFAGRFTTSEVLPPLLVELANRPEWARKIAAEPLEFDQIEGDNVSLRFVCEVLRHYPPEVMIFRANRSRAVDLGEHGHIPAGCNIAINFGAAMWSLGSEFDPDLWTPQVRQRTLLTFGGHSPHNCVGRSIALIELQLFARIVCRSYDVEVVDSTRVRNWQFGGLLLKYKDDLKVKVTKRSR